MRADTAEEFTACVTASAVRLRRTAYLMMARLVSALAAQPAS
jgi:hypothetical protein